MEVQEKGRSAHYKLTSTVMLWLQTIKAGSGTMNLGGSLFRQVGGVGCHGSRWMGSPRAMLSCPEWLGSAVTKGWCVEVGLQADSLGVTCTCGGCDGGWEVGVVDGG